MGHAHFSNDKVRISWLHMGLVRLFSVVECLKNRPEKLALKSVDGHYAPFSTRKEIHLRAKAYLYVSHLEALFSLYFLYKGCFCHLNGLLLWVGAYGQR